MATKKKKKKKGSELDFEHALILNFSGPSMRGCQKFLKRRELTESERKQFQRIKDVVSRYEAAKRSESRYQSRFDKQLGNDDRGTRRLKKLYDYGDTLYAVMEELIENAAEDIPFLFRILYP
jgi:hypothetical protein